jgi:D-threo-aldose 1-dehydrogenase
MMARDWERALPGGKRISALGFGCSSIWAKPQFAEDRAQAILIALLAEGVNHFDTAPSYGAGLGELRLGRFLAGRNPDDFVLSTKIAPGLTREAMEHSFLASLQRLGLERVDCLYLHGPALADLNDTAWRFFDDLKAQGLIGLSGVNSFDNAVLAATAASPVDAVMLQYSVGDFRNAAAMEQLHGAGKIILSGTALARASFDLRQFVPTSRTKLWYLLRMLRHDPAFAITGQRLKRRLEQTGLALHDAAIRFVTGHPLITSSLFGTSSSVHAVANARAGHQSLTTRQWTSLASHA